MTRPLVGVLALQGAVREHVSALASLGAQAVPVKTPEALAAVDALVLPGGESTAMARLARPLGLMGQIGRRVDEGMPVLGTCAGLILLARDVADSAALAGFETVGVLDVTVRRNAYGPQLASGETDVVLAQGGSMRGVFIRAPRIERVGAGVEVIATHGNEPVAVRDGSVLGCTYHPELAGDTRLHQLLLDALDRPAAA